MTWADTKIHLMLTDATVNCKRVVVYSSEMKPWITFPRSAEDKKNALL